MYEVYRHAIYNIEGKTKDDYSIFSKFEDLNDAINQVKRKKGHYIIKKDDETVYDNKKEPCIIATDFSIEDLDENTNENLEKRNGSENNGYYVTDEQDFSPNAEVEAFEVDLRKRKNWPTDTYPFLVPRDDSYDKESEYVEIKSEQPEVVPIEPKTIEKPAHAKYNRFYKKPKPPKTEYKTYREYPSEFVKKGKRVDIEQQPPPNVFQTDYFSDNTKEQEGVGFWQALVSAIPVVGSMFQKQPEVKTTQKQQYVQQSANQVWPWILIGTTSFVTLTVLGYLLGQRITAKKARHRKPRRQI